MTDGDRAPEAVRHTIAVQAAALNDLSDDETVERVLDVATVIDRSDGRVIFTGVGKSGDIAKKVIATLNSIGTSAYFVHPTEALHGDLGAVSGDDTVVFISNSGNTEEIVDLHRFVGSLDPVTVGITSNPQSKLGQAVDHHINTKVETEGSVVDLVPMASTTATMVIGDCIANALMARHEFGEKDFGHFHPGGTIGKRLLLDVADLLYTDIPKTNPTDTLAEVALKMSDGAKGIAVVRNEADHVQGILTDGDVRRLLEDGSDLHDVAAEEVMITDPITVTPDVPAIEALEIIERNNITQLVVTDDQSRFEGIVHIHDIMREGLSRQSE